MLAEVEIKGRPSRWITYQALSVLARDEGATAVEYALIIGLIALAIIGAVFAIGGFLLGRFDGAAKIF
ncbi:MAG: Flp family type IVb pilin [Actinobacteria bacterium]|nr:Flp family type IVb pilin [Actinomycetota bacterium]